VARPHAAATATLGPFVPPAVGVAARTALAPDARLLLDLPDAESVPLVAVRQAGLGRAAAFTSAPLDGWAPAWASTEGARILRALLAWVAAADDVGTPRIHVAMDGPDVRVVVRDVDANPAGAYALQLPDGRTVPCRPTAPGHHEARWPLPAAALLATLVDGATGGPRARVPIPGGAAGEWDGAGVDRAGCERVAALAGGSVAAAPALWRPATSWTEGRRRLDGWCLAAAVLALLGAFAAKRR
jgi:hypothetical protein